MLDVTHNYKPLDFGNGLVAGSVNDQGRLVSLNTYHPEYGYATLTCVAPFPEDRWYDPAYVRSYRAALAAPEREGFGLTWRGVTRHAGASSFEAGALPHTRLTLEPGVHVDVITFAPSPDGAPAKGAIQLCLVTNEQARPCTVEYQWGGAVSLTRASYAQLTEGGPLARPGDEYVVAHGDQLLSIDNHGLGCAVAVLGLPAGGRLTHQYVPPMIELHVSGTLQVAPSSQARLAIVYGLGDDAAQARAHALALASYDAGLLLRETRERWTTLAGLVAAHVPADRAWLVGRALTYILACCAVPTGATTCLITDHQLLPLAWTRDAYYQIQAVLALRRLAARSGSTATPLVDELDELVRRHLVWLFDVAERLDGYWGRAYLTTGTCKDRAFQLDQQCYPLLQLADYVRATGDIAVVEQIRPHIDAILDAILRRRATEAWLFPTGETPADDEVEYPYHLSSQILLWRTFQSLTQLQPLVHITHLDLTDMADRVRQDVYRHMVVPRAGHALFCYLTDLQGGYRLYHDANDLPTVLAPRWGFCTAGDPIWQATMAFAFSAENRGGYYPGRYGGLGSVHTPHPWPLGDVQELLIASTLGDHARAAAVWTKLAELACWDGLFPEAYDETSGAVASRHWFAWPGAALAMAALDLE